MRDEATARPWEVRPWKNSIGVCNPTIKDNYQSRIAECFYWENDNSRNRSVAKANAALIVRAVNTRDAALSALREARGFVCVYQNEETGVGRNAMRLTAIIDALLAPDGQHPAPPTITKGE